MKVIDLLNKIANEEELPKKIKYSGHIYKFDETRNDYENEEKKDWTLFYNRIGKCRNMIDCLNDEVEIIEEIEKPKDIQKLTICGKDIGYGVMEEWLDFPPYQNEKKICSAIEQIAINQNKIIEAVNYLLKKEEKK